MIAAMASLWAGTLLAQPAPRCVVDAEAFPFFVPACVLVERHGEEYVTSKYLNRLDFDGEHLAWLRLLAGGFVYVDRTGRIVIRDVAMMDNGADDFHRGLVRLQRGAKFGFADPTGRIVVPIQYDGAINTDEDGPKVCVGCGLRQEGEHAVFTEGKWFTVDARGGLHAIPDAQSHDR